MLSSNRNEFLRDSSRIQPILPDIRKGIVSESGMTRSSSRSGEKINETSRIPPNKKKSICGDSGNSWPVWNRGIRLITPSRACEQSQKLKQIWQILEHNQDQSIAPGWQFCQWRTAIFFQVKESGSRLLDLT